jgi:hypothetical protein
MRDTGDQAVDIIPLARKKMMQRGSARSWVREAVMNSDQVVAGHGGRRVAHKRDDAG